VSRVTHEAWILEVLQDSITVKDVREELAGLPRLAVTALQKLQKNVVEGGGKLPPCLLP
jgi:hypothetical protein